MAEGRYSYEASGVSIERGERAVEIMKRSVEATHGPEVIGGAGGFAGLYALAGYRAPVLASTVDGIGTKVLVAHEAGRYESLGGDIVNHCANDVLVTGARPLLFVDYIGAGKVVPETVARVVGAAAEACGRLGIALVGGETAEMPEVYGDSGIDVVGTCVGACERAEVVTGESVEVGDAIIGLASSGLHTNGYTLARKVVEGAGLSYSDTPEGFGRSIGEVYLQPHRSYVREVLKLREVVEVRGMAHVTGGGLSGNLPRSLGGLGARLIAGSWNEPEVFGWIRRMGGISEAEMWKVFNLGIGFCVVVESGDADRALGMLRKTGCEAWRIGEVVDGSGEVEFAR